MLRHEILLIASLLAVAIGCSRGNPPATTAAPSTTAEPGTSASDQAQASNAPGAGTEASRDDALRDDAPQPPATATAPSTDPGSANRPKLKSRWGRAFTEQIDKMEGGTSAERDLIRDTLQKNDDAVDRALTDLPGRIEAANNTHDGPRRIAIPAP